MKPQIKLFGIAMLSMFSFGAFSQAPSFSIHDCQKMDTKVTKMDQAKRADRTKKVIIRQERPIQKRELQIK